MPARPLLLLVFAVAALLTGAVASGAGAQDLVATIKTIKPSIVGVGSYRKTRRPPADLRGTGFVVADGRYVITNAHVVAKAIDPSRGEFLAIFIGTGKRVEIRAVDLVAKDLDHDTAVLRLSGAPRPALALGDDDALQEGRPIAFTGFPIGAVLGLYPVTHRGIVSARTPIAIPARAPSQLDSNMIRRLKEPYVVFQLDATAYPGNSGSPLYDPATGAVYGIISSVFVKSSKERILSDPSGITYAIPIRYARDLLRGLGVP